MIPVVLAIGDQIVEAYSRIGLVMALAWPPSQSSSMSSLKTCFVQITMTELSL